MTFSLSLLRYVIVGFASVGIAINLGSLIMLMRKRSCTMFHNLLKVRFCYPFLSLCSKPVV